MERIDVSRRSFIEAMGAGVSLAAFGRTAAAKGPNGQIVMGCIGVGARGCIA